MKLYDPVNWYYQIANENRVFSSRSGTFVPIDDATYVEWSTIDENFISPVDDFASIPQFARSQDLMTQFTSDDLTKIKAAIDANIQFWGFWSALQAQADPMFVSSARFQAGWTALVQVLGVTRMNAIAIALKITIQGD